jgi:hypothetical protein
MKAEDLEEAIFDLRSKTEEELADSHEETQRLEEANYWKKLRVLELEKEIAGLEQEKTHGSSSSSVEGSLEQQETNQVIPPDAPQSPKQQRRRSLKNQSPLSPASPPGGHRLSWGPFGEKLKIEKEVDIMEYLSITEQGTKIMVEAAKNELYCQEEQVMALEMTSEAQENAIYHFLSRDICVKVFFISGDIFTFCDGWVVGCVLFWKDTGCWIHSFEFGKQETDMVDMVIRRRANHYYARM